MMPVAVVEVGLPVQAVVLVGPRHVPHGGAGEGHRRVAGGLGAQAELGVVPLDEDRQREADLLEHDARDQAHEPAVEVDVGPLVQPARGAQVAGREVPVRCSRRGGSATRSATAGRSRRRSAARAAVEVEHVAADDGGPLGEVAEGHRTDDALGLADHVVVHHHRIGRGALADALELAAGIAAGAAEVALHEHPQLVAEAGLRGREVGAVGDLVCPGRPRGRCRGRAGAPRRRRAGRGAGR